MSLIELFRSKRLRRLSKEGLWVVAGQVAAIVGALAGVRVLTELLAPAAYGELALGMTIAALINQTVLGPLGHGITRFYAPAVEEKDVSGYMRAAQRMMRMASGIVALMAALSILSLIVIGKPQWIILTLSAFCLALFIGYNSILGGIQNAARQRSVVALHQGGMPWLRFLMAAGLILLLGANSTNAMIGYTLASAMILGSQLLFFLKLKVKPESNICYNNNWQHKIWSFSWPISTFGLFTWMHSISDKWALELFSTTDDVGHYAVLYQLGYYPIALASGVLMQLLGPIFYQRSGAATDAARNANVRSMSWRLTGSSLVITVIAFILVHYAHAAIFRIFVADEYRAISYLLPWMILAGGLFASGQTLALNLMSQLKIRIQIVPKITTAIIGLTLNLSLANLFGIKGIAAAAVLFSAIFFAWYAMLTIRCKTSLDQVR